MYDLIRSVLNCTKAYSSYIFQNKIKYVFVFSGLFESPGLPIYSFHPCL